LGVRSVWGWRSWWWWVVSLWKEGGRSSEAGGRGRREAGTAEAPPSGGRGGVPLEPRPPIGGKGGEPNGVGAMYSTVGKPELCLHNRSVQHNCRCFGAVQVAPWFQRVVHAPVGDPGQPRHPKCERKRTRRGRKQPGSPTRACRAAAAAVPLGERNAPIRRGGRKSLVRVSRSSAVSPADSAARKTRRATPSATTLFRGTRNTSFVVVGEGVRVVGGLRGERRSRVLVLWLRSRLFGSR